MGLFDEIIADFKCPHCGYLVPKENMEKNREDKNDK